MSRDDELETLGRLITGRRWAALATLEGELPYASAVAYAAEPEFAGLLLHLSGLAPHTRNLMDNPAASLMVSEEDDRQGDPQTLARVSLLGSVEPLAKGSDDYRQAQARYLARLPDAEPLFGFGDFSLFRFIPDEARFVGGFGRARQFAPSALARAAALAGFA